MSVPNIRAQHKGEVISNVTTIYMSNDILQQSHSFLYNTTVIQSLLHAGHFFQVLGTTEVIRTSGTYIFLLCMCAKSCHSCPTLFDPMDYSPLCSSVHGISQARILESVVISFSRGSSQPRDSLPPSYQGRLPRWHCCC